MIELLNLALAGGMAAAAAPVLIHIAHRRKLKPIDWGAMRFLQTMLQRRRRSLSIENLLLLLIRMLALACLAIALMRPNFTISAGALSGDVISRGAKTAAVLLIDDGVSTGEGRTMPAIDQVKKLALAYLDTLKTGDEVSIIPLSRLRTPPADPLYDIEAARQQVKDLRPTALASDVPAMLEAGVSQLTRHLNPEVELVMVSDGRGDGWRSDDRLRWEDLRRRLSGSQGAEDGTRARPHLVLLAARGRCDRRQSGGHCHAGRSCADSRQSSGEHPCQRGAYRHPCGERHSSSPAGQWPHGGGAFPRTRRG